MTTISPALLEQYQIDTQPEQTYTKELGQEQFLDLMMAQLKHQDPMEPMDNGEFLGQMAQFSTVTGIDEMKNSLDKLSTTYSTGQTLQSTQLVGKEVLLENDTIILPEKGDAAGSFDLEVSSGSVQMDINSSSGAVIRQIPLGQFPGGRHAFSWDGTDENGSRVPAGNYTVKIVSQNDDVYTAAPILTTRIIDSVEFGNGSETILNTRQGESISLSDIKQIRQNTNNTITSESQK